ncbi:MAG: hypothetical protein ACR2PH_05935 [Desulfobulbia bacterium]
MGMILITIMAMASWIGFIITGETTFMASAMSFNIVQIMNVIGLIKNA